MAPRHDHNAQVDDQDAWGSSTNEPITWGQTKARNHEEELKLWNASSSCVTEYDGGDDKGVNTTEPIPARQEYCYHHTYYGYNTEKAAYAKEERDDEIEFTRIPIAGEDSEDYDEDAEIEEEDDDAEIEEEEDEILRIPQPIEHTLLPYVPSGATTYVHQNTTGDDIALFPDWSY